MVFHWSLSDSKSLQVSRTLLSILAVLNNIVVWLVSTRPLISKSSSPFNNPLVTVPKAPITISIIVSFIFIINGFWTIAFIFIIISLTFRPIYPPAFFRCLSNSGTFTEFRITPFIEFTKVACSDCVSHNRVQVVVFLYCSSPAVRIEPATSR